MSNISWIGSATSNTMKSIPDISRVGEALLSFCLGKSWWAVWRVFLNGCQREARENNCSSSRGCALPYRLVSVSKIFLGSCSEHWVAMGSGLYRCVWSGEQSDDYSFPSLFFMQMKRLGGIKEWKCLWNDLSSWLLMLALPWMKVRADWLGTREVILSLVWFL